MTTDEQFTEACFFGQLMVLQRSVLLATETLQELQVPVPFWEWLEGELLDLSVLLEETIARTDHLIDRAELLRYARQQGFETAPLQEPFEED